MIGWIAATTLLAPNTFTLSPCHLVTLSPCHPLSPCLFAAETPFPRGPGLYFSPVKLIVLIIIYLFWVRTSWWVDRDTHELKLARQTWNLIMFACGLLSMIIVWVLP